VPDRDRPAAGLRTAGSLRPAVGPLARTVQRLREAIVPGPRIDVAATDIRRRIREHRSIRYLVPDPVREYIERSGLYSRASR